MPMSRNIAASTVQNIRKSVSGLSNSAQLVTNAANAMIESLNGSGRPFVERDEQEREI